MRLVSNKVRQSHEGGDNMLEQANFFQSRRKTINRLKSHSIDTKNAVLIE